MKLDIVVAPGIPKISVAGTALGMQENGLNSLLYNSMAGLLA